MLHRVNQALNAAPPGPEKPDGWTGGGRANPATKNDTSNAQNKHTERTLKTRRGGVRQGDT